jgi:transcriptional regulator with XRE-family HTH domain
MDMRKLVGRNFARLRLAKGFTQERFAELSGFTQQYVSGLERGRRNPTVVTLYHLAQALGVSHVELVTPDEEALRESTKPPSGNKEFARTASGSPDPGCATRSDSGEWG